MRSLLLILPLLTACAHAPAELTAAKASVDSRYTYSYRMTSRDYERSRPEDGTANCSKYAVEYWVAVMVRGYGLDRSKAIECVLPSGVKHSVVVIDNTWVLDNRYPMVVNINNYDCKPI
jgi:hypothetical protein